MSEGRTCSSCGVFKRSEEFGKDKRARDGLKAKCRPCETEYMRQYHLSRKEELNQRSRDYYQKHKDEILTQKKQWRIDNPDEASRRDRRANQKRSKRKHREQMRRWRRDNPEEARAIARRSYHKHRHTRRAESKARYRENSDEYKAKAAQYRKENKERVLKWNRDRKMRKMGIPGYHTLDQWYVLCSFFEDVCPCCGEERGFTVDHIIPVTWDGATDWITNIQPLCGSCNTSKRNGHATDYRPEHVREWARKEFENQCHQLPLPHIATPHI